MPLISDPGFTLVRACVAAGLEVEVLPGPSAVLAALVASGLPADHWRFAGFLPRRAGELRALLAANDETLVAFESPQRAGRTLALLAELDPQRPLALCRELTKVNEEIVRGTAAELAARYASTAPRGEVALVIGAAQRREDAEQLEDALAVLRRLIDAGAKPRPAAAAVADLTGIAANRLYRALTS
jgi:16S rRNA (cytidine1402-2'-O)-methyltransferase